MSEMTYYFTLASNSISLSIPTQLGQMAYSFYLNSNSISSTIPTQLGQMGGSFYLKSNKVQIPPPGPHPPRAQHHLSL